MEESGVNARAAGAAAARQDAAAGAMAVRRYARTVVVVGMALLIAACGQAETPPAPGPLPPPASPPAPFDPWQNARERGIDFRAVGQEPGWYAEVDHERGIRLMYDYGEQVVVVPAAVQPTVREGTRMYSGAVDDHQLEIAIEDTACKDAMSGDAYPNTVTVNIDGRALRGCGRSVN
jgi:putative lipoprotein